MKAQRQGLRQFRLNLVLEQGTKTVVGVESYEEVWERKFARAEKLDRGLHVEPERRITFESLEDMLSYLTPKRIAGRPTSRF